MAAKGLKAVSEYIQFMLLCFYAVVHTGCLDPVNQSLVINEEKKGK